MSIRSSIVLLVRTQDGRRHVTERINYLDRFDLHQGALPAGLALCPQ
jgi:hypothetical protein